MEITDLEAVPVEASVRPRDQPGGIAPYVTNHGQVEDVVRVLIRLETDEGVTGWGEMRPTLSSAATVAVLENDVAPEVVGRDVWEMAAFRESFFHEYLHVDSFLGGVEVAMWDALGKALGAPLHQLLGGKTVDPVPMAYCVGILDPEESREHARRALDRGFDVLKTKAGRDWEQDVERIVAMDDEADGELEFRLDPNQGWAPEDAVRVGARLEDAGVYLQYLEQPVRVDSAGTYRQLRSRLRTPVAVNEDTYYPRNLAELVAADAVDAGVVDLVAAGGITGLQRLAAVASEAGVSLAHHNAFDLGVKTAAVCHAVAATPAVNLPPDTVYYAWEDHVLADPLTVADGAIAVPEGPGLGVEVDEAAVERLRIEPRSGTNN